MAKIVTRTVATSEIRKLPVHPYANKPPMESEENLRLLGESMRKRQYYPVIVCNGVLIDGRNRLRAAELMGIDIRVEYRTGVSESKIESMIDSLNFKRRDLPPRVRAQLALAYLDDARAAGRKVTITEAAERYNASKRTVDRYIQLRKNGGAVRKRRVTMGRIPNKHQPMIKVLNNLWRLKAVPGRQTKFKKYDIALTLLANEILGLDEMKNI